ncbi:MAG: methyltransferase domain-containing protein [Anaerolineae bacterium]|nr:methyltransferase domain-containing protein [Anaerolineae bacterium]
MSDEMVDLRASYDRVAADYAEHWANELDHKPFDRDLLDRFAARLQGAGSVCDLGCGPGHMANYLYERGVSAFGLDLSAGMVEQAKKLFPHINFRQGDMLALDNADASWAGVAAFYSLIHIPRERLPQALGELYRVLVPGGLLLVSYHAGSEVIHLDDWWDKRVSVDFIFYEQAEMTDFVETVGFTIIENHVREPYTTIEHANPRGYILAQK